MFEMIVNEEISES